MKKVLVTGAAGFIGHKVCEFLLKSDIQVTGIDNLNNYYDVVLKEKRLDELRKLKNFSFEKIDIENKDALFSLFKKNSFDVVFNLAARAGVKPSMENPDIYMSTNTHGSLNLLEACKTTNVRKFVLASTSSLYAGQTMPFLESLPVNTPISPYAATKKSAEMMAHVYHYLYGIDVSIVRYFTVFGPSGRPDMSIFRFIQWIYNSTSLKVFGDGSQARDFTYVEDIARGTILAAKPVGYEIINLGGGNNPISLKTVIHKIEEILGKKAKYDYAEFHKTDIRSTWADISKAKKILGWQPEISFNQGLQQTIQWHLDNQSWLKSVKL